MRVGIAANAAEALASLIARVEEVLPEFEVIGDEEPVDHQFIYKRYRSGRNNIYKNDEPLYEKQTEEAILERFGTDIRLTVAEHAVGRVFIHAGAVSWKGRAIVIPAQSFQGKSTLTAELVRRGALYYSDEYAILDRSAMVHPFPKKLSMRGEIDAYRQVDHPVEAFGGTAATEPALVRMVLITGYKPGARLRPRQLTPAAGLMEVIKNTLPIRRDPQFTLDVLRRLSSTAVIVKTNRGEASDAADRIIEYFECNCLGETSGQHAAAS